METASPQQLWRKIAGSVGSSRGDVSIYINTKVLQPRAKDLVDKAMAYADRSLKPGMDKEFVLVGTSVRVKAERALLA